MHFQSYSHSEFLQSASLRAFRARYPRVRSPRARSACRARRAARRSARWALRCTLSALFAFSAFSARSARGGLVVLCSLPVLFIWTVSCCAWSSVPPLFTGNSRVCFPLSGRLSVSRRSEYQIYSTSTVREKRRWWQNLAEAHVLQQRALRALQCSPSVRTVACLLITSGMLNKWRRWFHSSRVKLPLLSVCARWFLMSTYLIWIFEFNLILSNEQPVKHNSVGPGYVSHWWTSSSDNHLDDCFVVFKNVQLRLVLRRMCVGGYVIHIWQLLNLSLSLFSSCFCLVFIDGMVSCPAQVSLD